VLVPSVCSHKGADKRSTIFISLHQSSSSSVFIFISLHLHQSSSSSVFIFISLYFSLHQLSESTSIPWFQPSPLFFSILSSMSFLDSGLAVDLGPANPTKPTSQEYGNHWISESAYNMHTMPFFHSMSRDSRTGKYQTASLSVGLLKSAARRPITIHDFRREGIVKVNSKLPILLRLQLAKYSRDTGYSTAQLMRFTGNTDISNVISVADNEQEYRRSPAGDGNVTSVKPTALTTENPGGSLSANSEEARVISIDEDSDMQSLTEGETEGNIS
jgi:hypothetical protein